MSSFKNNLIIFTVMTIIIYFNNVHAGFYDYCIQDLIDLKWDYPTGITALKVRIYNIPLEDVSNINLANEGKSLINNDLAQAFEQKLKLMRRDKTNADKHAAKREADIASSLHVQAYSAHLLLYEKTPELILNGRLFCLLESFQTLYQNNRYFQGKVSLMKASNALNRLKMCFTTLMNKGFTYKTGSLNFTFGSGNVDLEKDNEFVLRYFAYLGRKITSYESEGFVLPYTWCITEVCRNDLAETGFRYPTANLNATQAYIKTTTEEVPQYMEYAKAYYDYLTVNMMSYKNYSKDNLSQYKNFVEVKGVTMDYLGMTGNFCFYIVCLDHIKGVPFVAENESQLKKEYFKTDEATIMTNHSDFVIGYYLHLKVMFGPNVVKAKNKKKEEGNADAKDTHDDSGLETDSEDDSKKDLQEKDEKHPDKIEASYDRTEESLSNTDGSETVHDETEQVTPGLLFPARWCMKYAITYTSSPIVD